MNKILMAIGNAIAQAMDDAKIDENFRWILIGGMEKPDQSVELDMVTNIQEIGKLTEAIITVSEKFVREANSIFHEYENRTIN